MMTDAKLKEKIENVVNFWNDRMPMMAMEEFAEAIQAISKFERADYDYASSASHDDAETWEKAYLNMVKELGDVTISIMALMAYYSIPDRLVQQAVEKKLNKEY